MRLQGKVAIVTGAARGIGKGIALKLAQEGANVVLCDVLLDSVNATAREIKEQSGNVLAVAGNIASFDEVTHIFDETLRAFSRVDIVVNNAGINRDAMLHKMTLEQWNEVIAVNLTGTFYMTQMAAKYMREQEYGRIINISSASWLGNIGQANYAASKAGVVGLSKTAARELARKNVTCNVICPGFIETDMTKAVPEKVWETMISKIPAGFAGKPSDIGNLVAFLASDEAAYITGEVINVGGGMVL